MVIISIYVTFDKASIFRVDYTSSKNLELTDSIKRWVKLLFLRDSAVQLIKL